jgi:hypothetical protein
MAIYKIFSEADSTIYSNSPEKNTGLDEILEVSVMNNDDPLNNMVDPVDTPNTNDDIRRAVIKFSDNDLANLRSITTASYKTYFKAYIAKADNLTSAYTLEFRPLLRNWSMGTGHVGDVPEVRNGVSWYQTGSYIASTSGSAIINWGTSDNSLVGEYSYYLTSGGGTWNSSILVTQSFDYNSSKDIEVDLTEIFDYWSITLNPNYGIIVKHTQELENNSGSFLGLSYFSNDTHTIYPPTLELRWDDSVYNTGSLEVIQDSNSVLTIANNMGSYKWKSTKVKVRVNSRDKYPVRTFSTASWYTTNKALPENSYWSLLDAKTNEIVFGFDNEYTKISCDATSSFFDLYMQGLQPERYYKILIKTELASGEVIDWDNDLIFKVTK